MRIGLLSDTHGFLDGAVFEYFHQCDEVWHAGDFGTVDVLGQLQRFKPTRGVFGNVDGQDLREQLSKDLTWDCAGVTVYMTHIGGYPGHYERGIRKELERLRPGLFLCGHSHVLKIMRDRELGIVHMNPGACGRHGWHLVRTLLRFTIDAGKIFDVEAIELGPRSTKTIPGGAPPRI